MTAVAALTTANMLLLRTTILIYCYINIYLPLVCHPPTVYQRVSGASLGKLSCRRRFLWWSIGVTVYGNDARFVRRKARSRRMLLDTMSKRQPSLSVRIYIHIYIYINAEIPHELHTVICLNESISRNTSACLHHVTKYKTIVHQFRPSSGACQWQRNATLHLCF